MTNIARLTAAQAPDAGAGKVGTGLPFAPAYEKPWPFGRFEGH